MLSAAPVLFYLGAHGNFDFVLRAFTDRCGQRSRIIEVDPERTLVRAAAPRTMILIDPDLEPAPTPKRKSAQSPAGPAKNTASKDFRIPSTRTLARFLTLAQEAVRLRGQVTVLLTTDTTIRDLNQRFRRKNKPTDVLSFPSIHRAKGPERIAGDVAISVETANRQAVACGHSLAMELKVLTLHGLLHLAGYDHETDDGKMLRREQVLRARLGLPLGLIERAVSKAASRRVSKPADQQEPGGARGSVLSHPSRKNKSAARVGHPLIERAASKTARQKTARPRVNKTPKTRGRPR